MILRSAGQSRRSISYPHCPHYPQLCQIVREIVCKIVREMVRKTVIKTVREMVCKKVSQKKDIE